MQNGPGQDSYLSNYEFMLLSYIWYELRFFSFPKSQFEYVQSQHVCNYGQAVLRFNFRPGVFPLQSKSRLRHLMPLARDRRDESGLKLQAPN